MEDLTKTALKERLILHEQAKADYWNCFNSETKKCLKTKPKSTKELLFGCGIGYID